MSAKKSSGPLLIEISALLDAILYLPAVRCQRVPAGYTGLEGSKRPVSPSNWKNPPDKNMSSKSPGSELRLRSLPYAA